MRAASWVFVGLATLAIAIIYYSFPSYADDAPPLQQQRRRDFSFCCDYSGIVAEDTHNYWVPSMLIKEPPIFTAISRMARPNIVMAIHDPARDIYISGQLKNDGTWEMNVFGFIQQAVASVPLFIDVGANIGAFSAAMAASGVRVLSIEAAHENVQLMRQTRALLVARNVQWDIAHVAVSDVCHAGRGKTMCMQETSTINHSNFFMLDAGGGKCAQPVQVTQLDHLLLPQLPPETHVGMLKLDIEGHEAHALGGAMRLLCTRIVHALVLEMNFIAKGCDWKRMMHWLLRLGYVAFHDSGPAVQPSYWQHTHTWSCRLGCNVVFKLSNTSMTPAQRLGNDCFIA